MMKPSGNSKDQLKRVLTLPSLIAVAVGVVVAQVVFVGILQGVGIGGAGFLVALIIAFVLTLFYVFTFSELALMLPKAGSISTYTEVSMGHFMAIIATVAGYFAPAMFALPAELFLLESVLDTLYPGSFDHIGLILLMGLAVLNLLGVDIFSKMQNLLACTMVVALLVTGVTGLIHPDQSGGSMPALAEELQQLDISAGTLVVLALWSFMALEFVCPLIEETKDPEKNIPRSMIIAAVALLIIYLLVAMAGYLVVPAEELAGSDIPHYRLVQTLFGDAGKQMVAVLAITATCSTINTVLATLPRMLLGMAHNGQVPKLFRQVHPRTKTPQAGIFLVTLLILVPALLFRDSQDIILTLMISAATIWLLAYIVAHVDLMILRRRYPVLTRPFRSPWYPFPQVIGIISMVFMVIHNSPSPEMTIQVYVNAGVLVLIVSVYAWFWVKYKMKKRLFEPESIGKVLRD